MPPYFSFHSQAYCRNSSLDRDDLDPSFAEHAHHFGFGGDAGMIGTGYPACVLALHAGTAHQDVLDGIVEAMSHVQHAGYVRRGDDHGIGFPLIGGAVEISFVQAMLVPLVIYRCGLKIFTQFHGALYPVLGRQIYEKPGRDGWKHRLFPVHKYPAHGIVTRLTRWYFSLLFSDQYHIQ